MNKELLVKLVFHARCPTSGFEQQGLRVLVRFGDVDSLSQAHIDIPFKIYNKKLVVIIHNSILSSTCRQYSMNFVQWFEKSYFLCQKKKLFFSQIQMYLLCWGYHFSFLKSIPHGIPIDFYYNSDLLWSPGFSEKSSTLPLEIHVFPSNFSITPEFYFYS